VHLCVLLFGLCVMRVAVDAIASGKFPSPCAVAPPTLHTQGITSHCNISYFWGVVYLAQAKYRKKRHHAIVHLFKGWQGSGVRVGRGTVVPMHLLEHVHSS
jgi:hypothetical protein